jgi:hypothetical protein
VLKKLGTVATDGSSVKFCRLLWLARIEPTCSVEKSAIQSGEVTVVINKT